MQNTHWFYDEAQANNYATLYEINILNIPNYRKLLNKDNSLKIYSSIIYPDGSLRTTLNDPSKYAIDILKGYHGKSDLVGKAYYKLIFEKQFKEDKVPQNMDKNSSNQAMFWNYNRKDRLIHTGSDPGVFAVLSIDLKTSTIRIVLINTIKDTVNNEKIIEDLREVSTLLKKIN